MHFLDQFSRIGQEIRLTQSAKSVKDLRGNTSVDGSDIRSGRPLGSPEWEQSVPERQHIEAQPIVMLMKVVQRYR